MKKIKFWFLDVWYFFSLFRMRETFSDTSYLLRKDSDPRGRIELQQFFDSYLVASGFFADGREKFRNRKDRDYIIRSMKNTKKDIKDIKNKIYPV